MFGDSISKIRSKIQQQKNLENNPNIKLELETRFWSYNNEGKYVPNVSRGSYISLLKYLRNLDLVESVEESTSESTNLPEIRRVTTIVVGDGPEIISWQRKHKLENIDILEYDLRIAISTEEILLEPADYKITHTRLRSRHSFILPGAVSKIDMTEITSTTETGLSAPQYEVEVEFLEEYLKDFQNGKINDYQRDVEFIFKILKGTDHIYTNSMKNSLIYDVTNILKLNSKTFIPKGVLVQARNIKRQDMIYGGIVGNKHMDQKFMAETKNNGTTYHITYKADGKRKMTIICKSGIWFLYPPNEFNLVIPAPIINKDDDDKTKKQKEFIIKALNVQNGTILDGELVDDPNNQIKNWYLIFDCLAFRNKNIQNLIYTERMKEMPTLIQWWKSSSLTMMLKQMDEIHTPQDFFRLVRHYMNERKNQPYKEDGLMFIPTHTIYNPRNETIYKNRLNLRVLTKVPDICKWKEAKDMTIDLAIEHRPNNELDLLAYDTENNRYVPFHGSEINPFTRDMITHRDPITDQLDTESVVEYEWDSSLRKLRPRKYRDEKSGPNAIDIAINNWDNIMNPITMEEITGLNLEMAFSYHKRLKRELYDSLTCDAGINILDIGSGKGGDISTWRKLGKDPNTGFVVAVEPNEEYRHEFETRLKTYKMENKVRIVPTGGEDTKYITEIVHEFIPGGKVDIVTLMLSMSFFWASDNHLESLVQTIISNLKPEGKIIFLTIDGDTVEQIFEPVFGGIQTSDKQISTATFKLYPKQQPPFGRALYVNLENSRTARDQHEFLVHLINFTSRLSNYGIELKKFHRADTEKLLSSENLLFSSMYSFGTYVNIDPNRLTKDITLSENIKLPPINYQIPTTIETVSILNPVPIPSIVTTKTSLVPIPQRILAIPQRIGTIQMIPSRIGTIPPKIGTIPPKIGTIPPKIGTIPSKIGTIPPKIGTIPTIPPKIGTISTIPPKIGAIPTIPPKIGTIPKSKQINPLPIPSTTPTINPIKTPQVGDNTSMTITEYKGDSIKEIPGIVTKIQIPKLLPFDEQDLPGLSVTVPILSTIDAMAINDDTYSPLTCTWYSNLIRIATIGDGSCFIHAFLKAFSKEYQENGSARFRMELVAKVRLFLALSMKAENPEYPGCTYWETSGRGAFPAQLMSEIKSEHEIIEEKNPGPTLLEEIKLDYSVSGMQYLFNSSTWLGDEVYNLIADVFNLDVYILRAKRGDLTPHAKTRLSNKHKNAVVIVGNTHHYEVVGVQKEDGFQTLFSVGDKFIEAINSLPSTEGNLFGTVNPSKFFPDEEFISNFVNQFVTPDKGLVVPNLVNNISPDKNDPFIVTMNRLMPKIEIAADRRIKYLNSPPHPILTELNSLTHILIESGWTPEKSKYLKEIVASKLIPGSDQTLKNILISARDEGLLNEEDVNTIIHII